MADEEQVKLLKEKGVEAWNKWRKKNPGIRPNLAGAKLRHAILRGADLRGANLSGADLTEAKLSSANLISANLHRANFNRAILVQANLFTSNLKGAAFVMAALVGANLTEANLIETDFTDCALGATTFGNVDLSRAVGLEATNHLAPSTIGIDTIYRSGGNIPANFLRGAGVPDSFIEYMDSLTGAAFEFYSCFISYSSKDQPFAERLHADLQANGVRCWFAPHHGQAGHKLHEQIDQAIRLHEKLLLILSTDSIKSEWVKTEIKKAAKRQKQEKKDVLFPVSLVPFDELREWECCPG